MLTMSEFWFTIGSGFVIGWGARWAWERIRAELDLLDRRYEAVRDRGDDAPFDFDASGGGPSGPDELDWPPPPRPGLRGLRGLHD